MPEIAEVRLNAEFLDTAFKNKPIKNIKINSGQFLKRLPKNWHLTMMEFLTYPTTYIKNVKSKGKLIYGEIQFNDRLSFFFTCSLGMSGFWTNQELKHNHLTFELINGEKISLNDPRRFGSFNFHRTFEEVQEKLDKLGIDFLVNESKLIEQGPKFYDRIQNIKPTKQVCEVLLDQTIFCGVGNYLKCEILFASKIHPATQWGKLHENEIEHLFHNTWLKCNLAYADKGASFKTFKDKNGELSGLFQKSFQVYNQKRTKNGLEVLKDTFNDGRSTYYCPEKQLIKL